MASSAPNSGGGAWEAVKKPRNWILGGIAVAAAVTAWPIVANYAAATHADIVATGVLSA